MKSWLEHNGTDYKTEEDGRIFPASNSSQSVIDLFHSMAENLDIELQTSSRIKSIHHPIKEEELWKISCEGRDFFTQNILFTTGSSRSGHLLARSLGHNITPLAPSLFSFKLEKCLFQNLQELVNRMFV